MPDKPKHLCKWSKGDIEKNFSEYRKIVSKPKFVCMKCGRVASSKKFLCKPEPLEK